MKSQSYDVYASTLTSAAATIRHTGSHSTSVAPKRASPPFAPNSTRCCTLRTECISAAPAAVCPAAGGAPNRPPSRRCSRPARRPARNATESVRRCIRAGRLKYLVDNSIRIVVAIANRKKTHINRRADKRQHRRRDGRVARHHLQMRYQDLAGQQTAFVQQIIVRFVRIQRQPRQQLEALQQHVEILVGAIEHRQRLRLQQAPDAHHDQQFADAVQRDNVLADFVLRSGNGGRWLE